jgi:hypothetical protein
MTSVTDSMHCGVESQFLVIDNRGRDDNDCNRLVPRDHRTVLDNKPSGGRDRTSRMVITALTRVVVLSDQPGLKSSDRNQGRYDFITALRSFGINVPRTALFMSSSE